MTRWMALTREVSPALGRCELTHLPRRAIDVERARRQHAAYEDALRDAGCRVERLAADETMPDAVFIEDTALVLPEVAILMRPGAASRRPEVSDVTRALAVHRPLAAIEAPETMDGGDVLCDGRDVYVGLSSRSGAGAIEQLGHILGPHGYRVHRVPVTGCLHLKSAATCVGEGVWLVNPAWVGEGRPAGFGGRETIEVDEREPFAANALRVGDRVIAAARHPRTTERMRARGIEVLEVDVSELAKAEGGVTCCSLIFDINHGRPGS